MNINERMAALEKASDEYGKTLWRVFEAVYGNGKPGLIADVQAIRQMLEGRKDHGRTWQWVVSMIIAAAAVVVAVVRR